MTNREHTTVYVVRHGESMTNFKDIGGGHVDTPLTHRGEQQAAAKAAELQEVAFDEVYSSDLVRAVQTAEIISGEQVPEDHKLFDLRERFYGSLEGGPNQVIRDIRSEQKERYDLLDEAKQWHHRLAPDVESDHEVASRFVDALTAIASDNPNKTILVGAHGGPIRLTLAKIGGYTLAELPSGSFGNAGHIKLSYSGENFDLLEVDGLADHA